MDIRKVKVTNEIIPPLLSSFKEYNSNLRTRLKANMLFLSFDEKSKKTFNKFILLSNERFKLMKYGGNLNHILSKQKNNYTKINNDIKSDVLFTTNYPNIERKKLIRGVNEFKSKEISTMREKIYETLRYHSIYDKKVKNHKLVPTDNSLEHKYRNKESFNNTSKTNDMDAAEKIEMIQSNTQQEIKNDQDNFTRGLEQYKIFLKNKKKELNEKQNKKVIKIYKNDFSDIESHIKENNIKILTYKTKSSDAKTKQIKEDSKFDINILYKIKNYKKNKSIFPKLQSFEKNSEDLLLKDKSTYSTKNSTKFNNSYKLFNNTDLKDTLALINEEARNSEDLIEKFDNQKLKFDKQFNKALGIINFENIDSDISKNFQETINEQKRKITSKKLTKSKESENEKIFEDFRRIYEEKKKQWKKVDEQKAKMKEEKEKEKEEVINYLFSLKHSGRNKKISK
jgi:hypothetical protein